MPKIFKVVREFFSATSGQNIDIASNSSAGGVNASTAVTSSLGKFITGLSNFPGMDEREIYEQFYIWEPEVSSTINKTAAMVRSSFNYFTIIDDSEFDNITQDMSEAIYTNPEGELPDTPLNDIQIQAGGNTNLLDEMKDTANEIARSINVPEIFETYAAMLYMQGELFLKKNDNLSLSILPNAKVTILDDKARMGGGGDSKVLISQENFLVVDEGQTETEEVLENGQFYHVKLYDVPLTLKDLKGRATFGIYSISPLQRCIIPIWMRRQLYIIETLWRWANVPREHHKIDAKAFMLSLYPGTPEQKRAAAEKDMTSAINSWSAKLQLDAPDQKYVTSSNITIDPLEHNGSSYMDSNGLLIQINDGIWDGIGMPKSVIRGKSDGSYASELVTASGASLFIEQMANKIARVVLENMRERLLLINPSYPVKQLDIKISFELAQSRLEKMKNVQLMKEAGIFTMTEAREEVDSPPLTEQQIAEEGLFTAGNIQIVRDLETIVKQSAEQLGLIGKDSTNSSNSSTTSDDPDFGGVEGGRSDGKVNYPQTPETRDANPSDKGDQAVKKVLND